MCWRGGSWGRLGENEGVQLDVSAPEYSPQVNISVYIFIFGLVPTSVQVVVHEQKLNCVYFQKPRW